MQNIKSRLSTHDAIFPCIIFHSLRQIVICAEPQRNDRRILLMSFFYSPNRWDWDQLVHQQSRLTSIETVHTTSAHIHIHTHMRAHAHTNTYTQDGCQFPSTGEPLIDLQIFSQSGELSVCVWRHIISYTYMKRGHNNIVPKYINCLVCLHCLHMHTCFQTDLYS